MNQTFGLPNGSFFKQCLWRTSSGPVSVNQNIKLLNGRVRAPEKRVETARFTFREERHASRLARSVLGGSTDVRACYCSVYDDGRVTSLQDRIPTGQRIGLGIAGPARSGPTEPGLWRRRRATADRLPRGGRRATQRGALHGLEQTWGRRPRNPRWGEVPNPAPCEPFEKRHRHPTGPTTAP